MPLPNHLERLRHISIDTLGLSESTLAVLKFYGLVDVLDCIAYFYSIAQERDTGGRSNKLVTLMFGEVKPVLVTSGYWDLILDADVWHALDQHQYDIARRRLNKRVVYWQGRDQNLYEIALGSLGGLDGLYDELPHRFNTIGECVDRFLYFLRADSEYRLETDRYHNEDFPATGGGFHEYLWAAVQPRLVALGYWRFVEEHLDDFEPEREEW